MWVGKLQPTNSIAKSLEWKVTKKLVVRFVEQNSQLKLILLEATIMIQQQQCECAILSYLYSCIVLNFPKKLL